jgi:hypothetical protein
MTPNATHHALEPSALNPVAAYILVLEDHPLVVQGLLHYLQGARPDLPARVAASWLEGQHTIKIHGRGQATSDGAGVKLTRVLTQDLQRRLDPFLMLDAFGTDNPGDYIGGFPTTRTAASRP